MKKYVTIRTYNTIDREKRESSVTIEGTLYEKRNGLPGSRVLLTSQSHLPFRDHLPAEVIKIWRKYNGKASIPAADLAKLIEEF